MAFGESPFKDCTDKELDMYFTLLVSASRNEDPFETERELKQKGIIKYGIDDAEEIC